MREETYSRSTRVDRAAIRHKTFERTSITVAGVTSTAHVLNLSTTGALVHSDAAVSRTTYASLSIGGRDVPGEIMWADGQRFGIRFDRPLAQDIIEATLFR